MCECIRECVQGRAGGERVGVWAGYGVWGVSAQLASRVKARDSTSLREVGAIRTAASQDNMRGICVGV